jgi:hypothetical protein
MRLIQLPNSGDAFVQREDDFLKLSSLMGECRGATGKVFPPTPYLHPIRCLLCPDFRPGASNGWRCSYPFRNELRSKISILFGGWD